MAACRWSAGWAALAARLAEASRSLTACCSTGWAALAARLAEASRSLTTCCSIGWAALAARLAEASRSLTACCSAGLAALATCLAEASHSLTACCSTCWTCCGSILIRIHKKLGDYLPKTCAPKKKHKRKSCGSSLLVFNCLDFICPNPTNT